MKIVSDPLNFWQAIVEELILQYVFSVLCRPCSKSLQLNSKNSLLGYAVYEQISGYMLEEDEIKRSHIDAAVSAWT